MQSLKQKENQCIAAANAIRVPAKATKTSVKLKSARKGNLVNLHCRVNARAFLFQSALSVMFLIHARAWMGERNTTTVSSRQACFMSRVTHLSL